MKLLFLLFIIYFCIIISGKRKILWQLVSTGRQNESICCSFWMSWKIRAHSENLSAFWMCLTTCKSLTTQWICKLSVKNYQTVIFKRRPSVRTETVCRDTETWNILARYVGTSVCNICCFSHSQRAQQGSTKWPWRIFILEEPINSSILGFSTRVIFK